MARKIKLYPFYLLAVLTVVLILNLIDRTIISILAEDIKEYLHVDDASLGLLYGTVFAVFYSVFGIPLARLADVWNRKKIIAVGLFLWSFMTALSGFATSFIMLALLRLGVGIGEASAGPASMSMISDSFSKKRRATAFGIWYTGTYVGGGLGFAIGGAVVAYYHQLFPDGNAPFGIDDWQLAMFVVGVPGLLMTILVLLLREPRRGQMDDQPEHDPHPNVFRFFLRELGATVPPFTLFSLYGEEKNFKLAAWNFFIGCALLTGAMFMTYSVGDPFQWFGIALGFYSFISWLQRLRVSDYPCFSVIFKGRALWYGSMANAVSSFTIYGTGFWMAPYLIRRYNLSTEEVGAVTGFIVIVCGFTGVALGGFISDYLKKHTPKARPYMGLATTVFSFPFALIFIFAPEISIVYFALAMNIFINTLSSSSGLALVSELALPRMRATSLAFYQLSLTLIGLSFGPYCYGALSDYIHSIGYSDAQGLQYSFLWIGVITTPIISYLFLKSSQHMERDELSAFERAKAAGEK